MYVVLIEVWILQLLIALIGAMGLLLGALTLMGSVQGWGDSSDPDSSPPLLPMPRLIAHREDTPRSSLASSVSMLTRAPPGRLFQAPPRTCTPDPRAAGTAPLVESPRR